MRITAFTEDDLQEGLGEFCDILSAPVIVLVSVFSVCDEMDSTWGGGGGLTKMSNDKNPTS